MHSLAFECRLVASQQFCKFLLLFGCELDRDTFNGLDDRPINLGNSVQGIFIDSLFGEDGVNIIAEVYPFYSLLTRVVGVMAIDVYDLFEFCIG